MEGELCVREARRLKKLAALCPARLDRAVALAPQAFSDGAVSLIHIENGIDFPETYEAQSSCKEVGPRGGSRTASPDASPGRCCGSTRPDALRLMIDDRASMACWSDRARAGIRGRNAILARETPSALDTRNSSELDSSRRRSRPRTPASTRCCTGPSWTCGSTSSRKTSR